MPAPAEIPIEELASMPTQAIWMRFARDPVGLARSLHDALLPTIMQMVEEDDAKSEDKTFVVFSALEREGCLPGMRHEGRRMESFWLSSVCTTSLQVPRRYTYTGLKENGFVDRSLQGRTVEFRDWFADQIPLEKISDPRARRVVQQLLSDGTLHSRFLLLVAVMTLVRHVRARRQDQSVASA